MASLLKEPFDGYAYGDFPEIFTTVADIDGGSDDSFQTSGSPRGSAPFLRLGVQGVACTSKLYEIVPQYPNISGNVCIFGFRFRALTDWGNAGASPSAGPLAGGVQTCSSLGIIRLAGSLQCWIRPNADGTISAMSGTNTLLGTSATALALNTVNYLEVKITVHPSAGTVDIHLNNASILSLTGQNTAASGSAGWGSLILPIYGSLSGGTRYWQLMDLYVADGSGTTWNDFMNDMRLDWVPVNAAGTNNDSTPSTGSDRSATVDENPMNGDTDYNTFSNINDLDTYNLPNAPVTGATILGLETRAQVRKTDAGVAQIKHAMLINGTVYLGTALSVPGSYAVTRQAWDTNPDTSAAWTDTGASGFNASELGTKKTA